MKNKRNSKLSSKKNNKKIIDTIAVNNQLDFKTRRLICLELAAREKDNPGYLNPAKSIYCSFRIPSIKGKFTRTINKYITEEEYQTLINNGAQIISAQIKII